MVVDEAHKMSASYFGNKVNKTKRFLLGRTAGLDRPRHFLLMTATPHNGKEEDFQLFMSLLDPIASTESSATARTRSMSPT